MDDQYRANVRRLGRWELFCRWALYRLERYCESLSERGWEKERLKRLSMGKTPTRRPW